MDKLFKEIQKLAKQYEFKVITPKAPEMLVSRVTVNPPAFIIVDPITIL